MANILSLALKINADASGLRLTPVERALQRLGAETDKVTSVFDKFADTSEVAARAQAATAKSIEDLTKARRAGTITAEQFAEEFQKIRDSALEEAAALQRAAQITEANLTPLQRYDRSLEELDSQLKAGRISQETYGRAVEGAAKGLTDAERAARGLAVQQKEIDTAAGNTTLKFNELSGVFAVLPGPLGNIAGRISGIASASEGLSRIFAGGLTSGISNLAASFTQLINPVTAALAGLTAVATLGPRLASALDAFESRVERLGNQANQLGVSFEFIQVVEENARRSGVSVGSLEGAFTRLQRTITEAGDGTKTAVDAFARLGLAADDLANLDGQQQLELIGQRIAAIEDPALRTAAAVEIFGRSGAQLLPFFNNLPRASDDVERLGRALTAIDKERIDEFGVSVDGLVVASQGLGNALLLPFVGLGDGIAVALSEITSAITAIVDPIGRILEPLLTNIGRLVEIVGIALGTLGRNVGAFFEPLAVIAQEVAQALEPFYEGIVGIVGFLGDASNAATEWLISFSPIGAIASNIGALGEAISRVVTIIATAFQRVGEFVGGLVSRFGELLAQSPFLQTLGEVIGSVFGSVASVFSTIANAIGGVVGRLLTIAENFLGIERSAESAGESAGNVADGIDQAAASTADLVAQQERAAQAAEKQSAEVQKIVDASLEQARIDNEFGGDSARFRAAENLLAVQGEIARVEEQLRAAREAGDQAAIDALASRLAILDQVAAREEDVASGARKQREEAERAAQQAAEQAEREAERAAQQAQRQAEQAAAQAERAAEQARREAEREAERAAQEAEREAQRRTQELERANERILQQQQRFNDRQFEIELARAEELANVRTGSVEINDIRSGGISAFFDTLNEDPAIAEAKKQTKELEAMRKELAKLQAEKVDILAGTG